ncbi:DoxX-like family protein [Chitinophaga niabensis]|uniref:DoxX-like family protein n=1 Tax=Chitinophaga niabensis TaxID=536979 RepID=UPI0031BAEEC7
MRTIVNIAIGLVWLVNGLYCKVLNQVPRHQAIVAEILGKEYASLFTRTIGMLEIGMFVWVISRIKSRWCAIVQIVTVAVMNIIEFLMVPHLLLFGRFNALIALLFIIVIYLHEFTQESSLRRRSIL